jgi:predicted Zn-dependent protease
LPRNSSLLNAPILNNPPSVNFSTGYGGSQEAEALLEKLLKLHPDYADAVPMLAELYLKQNRVADAAALYDSQLARKDLSPQYRAEFSRLRSTLPK